MDAMTFGKVEIWFSIETGYNLLIEGVYVALKLDSLTIEHLTRIIDAYFQFMILVFPVESETK